MSRFSISIILLSLLLIIGSCKKKQSNTTPPEEGQDKFVRALDISSFPKINQTNPIFYNTDSTEEEFLTLIKKSGVNTIRLRLWVHPENEHSGLNEVKNFAALLKTKGFRIWLSLHYSDTWADPGNQEAPKAWQNIPFYALTDSVYKYTKHVISEINPELIQIGNEINPGLLFPYGHIDSQFEQFKLILSTGIQAVRDNSEQSKVILHYAGYAGSDWFFNQLDDLDYDIIGLSYYPIWHGKDLSLLQESLASQSIKFNKELLIAETAYPFTLGWNDWTNNIVGIEDQLILPQFPATDEGQKAFIHAIRNIVMQTEKGLGFCYWGAELIAFDGPKSVNGSPWENQAIFNFNNRALPVLNEFQKE